MIKSKSLPSIILISIMIISMTSSCDVIGKVDNAYTEALDLVTSSISSLQLDSSRWRTVIQDLIDKFPEKVNSTIRNEVTRLSIRTIETAGLEAKCYTDFVIRRTVQQLQRVKVMLENEINNENEMVPSWTPEICLVDPPVLDLNILPESRAKEIFVYGYDLDALDEYENKLAFRLVSEVTGQEIDLEPKLLVRTSQYQHTIIVGGDEFENILINGQITKIRFYWNNIPLPREGGVALKQFSEEIITLNPSYLEYYPTQTGEDDDFHTDDEHPMAFKVEAKVTTDYKSISINVCMYAKESGQGTEVGGSPYYCKGFKPIYENIPEGKRIMQFYPNTGIIYVGKLSEHGAIKYSQGDTTVVNQFIVYGDHSGDDTEVYTHVEVWFNPITIILTEDKGYQTGQANCAKKDSVYKYFVLEWGTDFSYCRNECYKDPTCKAWFAYRNSCNLMNVIPHSPFLPWPLGTQVFCGSR